MLPLSIKTSKYGTSSIFQLVTRKIMTPLRMNPAQRKNPHLQTRKKKNKRKRRKVASRGVEKKRRKRL